MRAPSEHQRLRLGLIVTGAILAGLTLAAVVARAEPFDGASLGTGQDAHAYWAASVVHPYGKAVVGDESAYLYSPAFLHVLAPLKALGWGWFVGVWGTLTLLALVALTGPVLLAPLLAFALFEVWGGNIHLLLALAVVLGFRWPATWSFVLLTKVTPGLGLLWFAVRREWRSLGIALGATAAVAGVSWAIAPAAWAQWLGTLIGNVGHPVTSGSIPVPLLVRLPVAASLIVWGARSDRRWVLPIATMLALPVVWYGSLTMLFGVVALERTRIEQWLLARLAFTPAADDQRRMPGRGSELAGSAG